MESKTPEQELKNVMGGSGQCDESPCNCNCETDSNCWGACTKCVPIHWQAKKVCSQNTPFFHNRQMRS